MKTLIPNYTYEPEKIECWLNQKLSEGFALKKWGLLFVHFEENLSGVQRYQIDVDDNRMEPNCERRNQLSDCGWEYVKTIYDSLFVSAASLEILVIRNYAGTLVLGSGLRDSFSIYRRKVWIWSAPMLETGEADDGAAAGIRTDFRANIKNGR